MRRSRIVYDLPLDARRELERRIIAAGFGSYADHEAWLHSIGHSISTSSLQRYGAQLKRIEHIRLATNEATALVESTSDGGELADATVRLAQAAIYELMQAADSHDLKTLSGAARSVADLARASRSIREERRAALSEAAEAAAGAARAGGVSEVVEAAIRRAIEGLA